MEFMSKHYSNNIDKEEKSKEVENKENEEEVLQRAFTIKSYTTGVLICFACFEQLSYLYHIA